ncbi:hypothetical protein LIER_03812 [Lithospermum erythrorhizon]|uniref:Uncharacterized protein n=1 Tax=Lithospermum erythrorhizon TaxID=34254 RepID=A0AAV3NUN3_LITER
MEPIKSFSFPSSFFATILFLFFISSPTLDAVRISDAVTSSLINATADQVWPYIEDYCNVYQYSPLDVSFCTTGVPNKPGLIRFLTLMGPPPTGGNSTIVLWEKQQLVSINPKKQRVLIHKFIGHTLLNWGSYILEKHFMQSLKQLLVEWLKEFIQNLIASST